MSRPFLLPLTLAAILGSYFAVELPQRQPNRPIPLAHWQEAKGQHHHHFFHCQRNPGSRKCRSDRDSA
jgi:hypothetical protein